MTKTEQTRLWTWRFKVLRRASESSRNVARTCRHFGISRQAFYKGKRRFDELGAAGLYDRPRTPHRSPRATARDVVSKILYLRQLSPGIDRAVLRASPAREARDEPLAGQSEASTASDTLDALRKGRSRATGCSWT